MPMLIVNTSHLKATISGAGTATHRRECDHLLTAIAPFVAGRAQPRLGPAQKLAMDAIKRASCTQQHLLAVLWPTICWVLAHGRGIVLTPQAKATVETLTHTCGVDNTHSLTGTHAIDL